MQQSKTTSMAQAAGITNWENAVEGKEALKELLVFQQLSEQIGESLDPDKVASALFEVVGYLISVKRIGLYVFTEIPSGGFVAVGPGSLEMLDQALSLRDEGVVDRVFSRKRPVFTPSPASLDKDDTESDEILLSPLYVGDKRVGILFVTMEESSEEINQFRQTLIFLASCQAAVAIKYSYDYIESERSKTYLTRILENVNDVIYTTDAAGIITFANHNVDVFGFQPQSLIGQPVYNVIPIDLDEGKTVAVLKNGESFEFEAEFTTVYDKKTHFSVNLVPLRDKSGKITGCLGILRDVSTQRQLEQESTRRKRLETLTEAAISINHEMNNPLTVIQGNIYLLENLFPFNEYPDADSIFKTIVKHVERISDVVKKFEKIHKMESVDYPGGLKMLNIHDDLDNSRDKDDAKSDDNIDNTENLPDDRQKPGT